MAGDDPVGPVFSRMLEGLKSIRYGSLTLTVHVRAGLVVRTELAKAEPFEAPVSGGAVAEPDAPGPRAGTGEARVLEACRG